MPRSIDRKKKPARLSGAINHNLSLYALAAGAAGVQLLALAQTSEAEVVYTSAHVVIGRNQLYSIDLNHDGTKDFTILNTFSHSRFSYERCHLKVEPNGGGAVVPAYSDPWAAALRPGVPIGPGDGFQPTVEFMAAKSAEDGSTVTYGPWFGAKNRYLGLNFKIDGQVHYGWARLTVRWNQKYRIVATLTGYAYETEAGKAIIAGDTGGAADEESQAEPVSAVPQKAAQPSPILGALSLGVLGLSIWRRPIL
jgi:hypothetical protein